MNKTTIKTIIDELQNAILSLETNECKLILQIWYLHLNKTGIWIQVEFISKNLRATESNSEQLRSSGLRGCEVFAIVFGLKKFDHYMS